MLHEVITVCHSTRCFIRRQSLKANPSTLRHPIDTNILLHQLIRRREKDRSPCHHEHQRRILVPSREILRCAQNDEWTIRMTSECNPFQPHSSQPLQAPGRISPPPSPRMAGDHKGPPSHPSPPSPLRERLEGNIRRRCNRMVYNDWEIYS
jgi:hypothetical protein